MDWENFLFRTGISVIGAVYSYLSSTTMEGFAWNMVLFVGAQALLAALAKVKPEDMFTTNGRRKETNWVRRLLSKI